MCTSVSSPRTNSLMPVIANSEIIIHENDSDGRETERWSWIRSSFMFSLERTTSQKRTERRTIHNEDRFTILFAVPTYLQEYSLNTICFLSLPQRFDSQPLLLIKQSKTSGCAFIWKCIAASENSNSWTLTGLTYQKRTRERLASINPKGASLIADQSLEIRLKSSHICWLRTRASSVFLSWAIPMRRENTKFRLSRVWLKRRIVPDDNGCF